MTDRITAEAGHGATATNPSNEDLWLALTAAFGPVLLAAFPDHSSMDRRRVCEVLCDEVRKRQHWFVNSQSQVADAAPELLEALKEIRRVGDDKMAFRKEWVAAINKADAAIARAQGTAS